MIGIGGIAGTALLTFVGVTTDVNSSICSPLTPPAITAPANGATVTGPTVPVSGDASAGATVTVSVDGTATVSLTADSNNKFAGNVPVANGSRTLAVRAQTPCQSQDGNSVNITVTAPTPPNPGGGGTTPPTTPNPTPPPSRPGGSGGSSSSTTTPGSGQDTPATVEQDGVTLTIIGLDGRSTSQPSIRISGYLSRAGKVEVYVNGKLVAANLTDTTNFGFTIPLNIGDNTIKVRGIVGDTVVEKTFSITRNADDTSTDRATDESTTGTEAPAEFWRQWLPIAALVLLVASGVWFLVAARRRREEDV